MQDLPVLFDATWRLVKQGGWIMFAVFILGQIGWYFVMERWWHYRTRTAPVKDLLGDDEIDPDALESRLLSDPRLRGDFAEVVRGLAAARPHGERAMVSKARELIGDVSHTLRRRLNTIAVVAAAAPLLGLAGTISGIMMTFGVISLYGSGNPAMMAGGIARALMITEAALVVALPLLILHDRLYNRAEAIENDCVFGASRLIKAWSGKGAS